VGTADAPISDAEADALFADLADERAVVLAVSGGPDSTALLHLMARWAARQADGPQLHAVTVDHGLRTEARREATAVKRHAGKLGVTHRTLRWSSPKPTTGLQEKARAARYGLLHRAALAAKARCVLTAHTLDDQAETILFRMARGSGLAGIGGMARVTSFAGVAAPEGSDGKRAGRADTRRDADVVLVRPFLQLPKVRLLATLDEAGVPFAQDPSNVDPRFTRARLRQLMPALAAEGLTAYRLAHLARRVRRSEEALDAIVDFTAKRLGLGPAATKLTLERRDFSVMPPDLAFRLLGRAIGTIGDEGPVELGKLEVMTDALVEAMSGTARFRRTLAGAMVSLQSDAIIIERAPARRR
jgi:tRNA(Ile)-lysidine synthase